MHNAAFDALGMDAVYLPFDVEPGCLMEVLQAMGNMGFGGVNLTVPLKEVAFGGLTDLDESAKSAGAVNTVHFGDDGARGYNTDGYGLLAALREAFGAAAEGEDIAMLGSGGAARGTSLVCAAAGARSLTLVARNRERTEKLARDISDALPSITLRCVVDEKEKEGAIRDATLVVQATTVGMNAGDPPFAPASAFRKGQKLYDLIYSNPVTSTIAAAQEAGADTANGLGMLLHQGARAFEIWTGAKPPIDIMRDALQKAAYP
jgi:shikimate dehydrogenase